MDSFCHVHFTGSFFSFLQQPISSGISDLIECHHYYFFFQASKIHPSSVLEHAKALDPESQSMPPYQRILPGISLVAQRFRLCASIAGGVGSVPSWETKILHASRAQPTTNKSSSKFRSPPGSGLPTHAVLLLTSSY